MIPKKIHYCWFGGKPLTEMAEMCIASWRKFAPDFEIIRWDESNFDVSALQYTKEAYEARKFAFVADVARLHALVNHGGIYMDTDVELIRSLDPLLGYEAVSGFETPILLTSGIMGATKGFFLFVEFLELYKNLAFINQEGDCDLTPNTERFTEICLNYGLALNNQKQIISGLTILPQDYFSPQYQGITDVTENTFCIHWFVGSWQSERTQLCEKAYRLYVNKLVNFLPRRLARHLARFIVEVKYDGVLRAFINIDSIKRHWKAFVEKWHQS